MNYTQDNIVAQDPFLDDPTLQNPDADKTDFQFDISTEMQDLMIGHILNDVDCVRLAAQHLPPTAFCDKALQIAAEIAIDFYKTYGKLPQRQHLMAEVKARAATESTEAQRLRIVAKVGQIEYLTFESPEYWRDKIIELAKRHTVAKATLKYHKDHDLAKFSEALRKANTITAKTDCREKWAETLDLQESEEWLMQNWLEFGSLAMLSGNPFSGKSHILTALIAGIVKHGSFARYELPKCAVLMVDAENKRRILVKRLNKALGDGTGDLDTLFSRVDTTRLTLPLPVETGPETIRQLIKDSKQETGQDKILVVIDTLRSVFSADEMENAEMKALLYPLQRVAQEENAAILILHHRPKSGASYSGQTSIAGACDYLWMWDSDIETGIGEIKLIGTRGDHEPALKFRLVDGKNEWIEDGDDSETEDSVAKILRQILDKQELNKTELVQQIRNRIPTLGINKAREMIDSLVGSLLVSRQGANNARYYGLIPSFTVLQPLYS